MLTVFGRKKDPINAKKAKGAKFAVKWIPWDSEKVPRNGRKELIKFERVIIQPIVKPRTFEGNNSLLYWNLYENPKLPNIVIITCI